MNFPHLGGEAYGCTLNSTRTVGGLFGSVKALSAVSALSMECIDSGSIHFTIHLPFEIGVCLLGLSWTLPSAR